MCCLPSRSTVSETCCFRWFQTIFYPCFDIYPLFTVRPCISIKRYVYSSMYFSFLKVNHISIDVGVCVRIRAVFQIQSKLFTQEIARITWKSRFDAFLFFRISRSTTSREHLYTIIRSNLIGLHSLAQGQMHKKKRKENIEMNGTVNGNKRERRKKKEIKQSSQSFWLSTRFNIWDQIWLKFDGWFSVNSLTVDRRAYRERSSIEDIVPSISMCWSCERETMSLD